jgi:hypothetical protein
MRAMVIGAAAAMLLWGPVQAAQLVTDGTGYSGPVIDIGHVPFPGYYFGNAPRVFGSVTISGDNMFDTTVYGQPNYGFGNNGQAFTSIIIATGLSDASVFIDFATPVAAFGAGFNYAPGLAGTGFPFPVIEPTLSAFDSNGDLIASFDLSVLAPIDAGGQNDYFAFRGIDGEGRGISRFVFTGSYIGMQVNGSADTAQPPGVPEPHSWAMLLTGFAGIGSLLRRRRRLRAA